MEAKKTKPSLLMFLLLPPVLLILFAFPQWEPEQLLRVSPMQSINSTLQENFPLMFPLRQLNVGVRYALGETEQNGIFIGNGGLMQELPVTSETVYQANAYTLLRFAELAHQQQEKPTVLLAVIPTASGVLTQNLPRFSAPVNQKTIIDNINNQMIGQISVADSYYALSANREKYLYYRTENTLTPLGGYYVYSEILQRSLLEEDVLPLNSFEISYGEDFYGSLYRKLPYQSILPDTLMYYRYSKIFREHSVLHKNALQQARYSTLYPQQLSGLSTYLGGGQGITKISSTATYDMRILIFGDHMGISYLPFLANHYGSITFVNLENVGSQIREISLSNYDQIFFIVDLATFSQTDVFAPIEQLAEKYWNN